MFAFACHNKKEHTVHFKNTNSLHQIFINEQRLQHTLYKRSAHVSRSEGSHQLNLKIGHLMVSEQ